MKDKLVGFSIYMACIVFVLFGCESIYQQGKARGYIEATKEANVFRKEMLEMCFEGELIVE